MTCICKSNYNIGIPVAIGQKYSYRLSGQFAFIQTASTWTHTDIPDVSKLEWRMYKSAFDVYFTDTTAEDRGIVLSSLLEE